MEIRLAYGKTFLSASLPDDRPVEIIEAPETPPNPDPAGAVRAALENPLGEFAWEDFRQARSVAIAVNDRTRPVPNNQLLPPLLARLERLGIPDQAITFHVAVGMHPASLPAEFPVLVGDEVAARYRVVSHEAENPSRLTWLGVTRRGTPVWCNREYHAADLKIVVGNIEPHQFAGFSGGVKSAAIGLAGTGTITANHSLLTHPDSLLGEYETNPARQDIEEIGEMIGVHLALNTVLNLNKEIVHVLAGSPRQVMQAGVPIARRVCQAAVAAPFQLVIASAGGHPKDINIYQAQKGLAHAARVTRPGGTLILAAACPEGAGSPSYESWVRSKHSHAEVLQAFEAEGFRIGPHKAFQISRDASQVRLILVSGLEPGFARSLLLHPAANLQAAVDQALAALPPAQAVGLLPHAAATIPSLP